MELTLTAVISDPRQRLLVRALIVTLTLLVFVSGIAVGLALRQFNAGAAPGDVSACVNNYSGAVRMSPYGPANCSANETQVTWPGMDTLGMHDPYVKSSSIDIPPGITHSVLAECNPGDVLIGGGFADPSLSQIEVHTSAPGIVFGAWTASGTNHGPATAPLVVHVMCASQ